MFMPLGRPLRAVGLAAAVLVCVAPAVAAQPGQVAPSYDVLIDRLHRMPAALEAAARSDAARERATQARALPNPTLAWDLESFRGTGAYRGFGNAESTVSLSQPLELFGQRGARIRAATAEADAEGLRGEQLRWQAAARLALAYAEAEAAARRHLLAEEALALTEQDARAVTVMVERGREAALRQVQAESEAEFARAALDEAQAIREAAFARLAAIAMLDGPVATIGDSLLDRVPDPHIDHTGTPLPVRIAQAELDATGRLVTVEQRRSRPDVSASIGRQRFRESGDEALSVGLALTVPLFDRNRAGIRAAHADRRAAEARLDAQRQEAKADHLAAEATLSASRSRTRAADDGVSAAQEAYRLARIGFDAGRIAQLELRSTRAALIAARSAAVDARVARVMAEIEMALVEGRAPFGEFP